MISLLRISFFVQYTNTQAFNIYSIVLFLFSKKFIIFCIQKINNLYIEDWKKLIEYIFAGFKNVIVIYCTNL